MSSNPCIDMDYRVGDHLKRQTGLYSGTGQSLCVRAWPAAA